MIDLHSHVLYGCDDGAKTLADSINMIRTAKEHGINKVCMTPHYMEDGYKTNKAELKTKLSQIKEQLHQEKLDVELYLGEEIFIFPSLDQKLEDVCCLNDSKYILVEIPMLEEITYFKDVVYKLISYGKVPILAHPERYAIVQKNLSILSDFCERGVLFQMNAASLTGYYGRNAKKAAKEMLKNHLVHFVASDAHTESGYEHYEEGINKLKKRIDIDYFEEITTTNPQKVLTDGFIE